MAAWLWARSAWRRRRGSLVLLAALVAIAGGVTIAAAVGARRADSAFERFIDQTGSPELGVDAIDTGFGWTPEQLEQSTAAFERAAALPSVARAQRLSVFAVAVGESPDYFSFALFDEVGQPGQGLMVAGRRFDPDDPTQAMVNEAGATAFGVTAGDQLALRTVSWNSAEEYFSQEASFIEADGPALSVTVTGVEREAFDIAQQDDPFVLLSPAFAREYADDVINCACIALFDAHDGLVEEALGGVEEIYGPLGYNVGLEEDGRLPEQIARGIDVEVTALWLLALSAGAAGLVIVAQAMARQATEGSEERATAAALGATTRQLTLAGALAMVPAVIIGALGAALVAVTLSPLTPRGLAQRAEVDPGLWIDPVAIGIGIAAIVVIGAALVVAVSGWFARRAAGRPQRLLGLPGALSAPGLLGVAFALRPERRGRAAASAALVATAIGAGAVVGVWTFESGRAHLLGEGRLFGVDADLFWRGPQESAEPTIEMASAIDGVEAIGVLRSEEGELTLESSTGSTISFATSFEAVTGWAGSTLVRGRAADRPDEVALGRGLLDELDVDLGDAVRVAEAGDGAALTVVGEVVAWATDQIDRSIELSPDGLTQLMAAICPEDASEGDCAPKVEFVVARTASGDAGAAARQRLTETGFAPIPLPSELDNVEQAGSLPWVLAAFLGLMGVAGLLHAIVGLLRQRRRDVVIARALGLSSRGARAVGRWSAATMVVIGVVVGIPLGIVAGRLIWAATARQLGAVVEQALPWWAPVIVAGAAIVLALALAELPGRRAARSRPADVLRAE